MTEGQPQVKRGRVKALFEEVSESESELSDSISSLNENDNPEMDIEWLRITNNSIIFS